MTGICAFRPAGVDVNRTLRIARLDVAVGREARLRGAPREGPECASKPPFHYEHEAAFTAQSRLRLLNLGWSEQAPTPRIAASFRVPFIPPAPRPCACLQ